MPMYDSLFASTYMLVLFMCCYFRNVGSEKHEEVEITFTSTRRSWRWQFNLSVESNQNVESSCKSVEFRSNKYSAVAEMGDRLATIDMSRKLGAASLFEGRAGLPSNTMWAGPRPTFVPNGILIHPAVWPQQTWTEIGGCAPLGEEELGPIWYNVVRAEAYLHAKFHLDPSNRLATIHQRYRQADRQTDRQDRQTTVR